MTGVQTCALPISGDCDDAAFDTHPGADELCDGLDNDCVAVTEAAPGETDGDMDGDLACADCDDSDPTVTGNDEDSDGYTECQGDCDDTDPATSSVNPELSDGQDNGCKGIDHAGHPRNRRQDTDDARDCQNERQGALVGQYQVQPVL